MVIGGGGLPDSHAPDTEILFVGYSYADLPFAKRFDVVFPKGRPQDGVHTDCHVMAATQDFLIPLPEIPYGWKTICTVHFAGGIPEMVRSLPVIDVWSYRPIVYICDEIVWEHLKRVADGLL